MGEEGDRIKHYKLAVIEESQGYRGQHREYSQQYFSKYVWCQMGTRLVKAITL